MCVSSISGTTPDEEERMWQLGMSKARQIHTNLGKIILRIQEEVTKVPKKPAHSEVIEQLKVEKTKNGDNEIIIRNNRYDRPDHQHRPTTTNDVEPPTQRDGRGYRVYSKMTPPQRK